MVGYAELRYIERDLLSWGWGCAGVADDEQGGFQAGRGRGLGVAEDGIEGFQGAIEAALGLVAEEEGAVVLSVGERFAEEERVSAPIGDGVAVNAGLSRGVSHVHAV